MRVCVWEACTTAFRNVTDAVYSKTVGALTRYLSFLAAVELDGRNHLVEVAHGGVHELYPFLLVARYVYILQCCDYRLASWVRTNSLPLTDIIETPLVRASSPAMSRFCVKNSLNWTHIIQYNHGNV